MTREIQHGKSFSEEETQQIVEQFNRDGYYFLGEIFTSEEASTLKKLMEEKYNDPRMHDEAGDHIVIEGGRSYFVVNEPDLYNVISLPEFGDAELKFSSNSQHFALFALTFGSYDEVY